MSNDVQVWQIPKSGEPLVLNLWPARPYQQMAYQLFMRMGPSSHVKDVNFTFNNDEIVFKVKPLTGSYRPERCCVMVNKDGREYIMSNNQTALQEYAKHFIKHKAAFFNRIADGLDNPGYGAASKFML
jgi:hypothetical protein